MSETSPASVKMTRVVPSVFVADVERAVDFYVNHLGFELSYRHDDPTCDMAILEWDDVEIHINTCACDDRRHVGNSYFEVRVDNAPALFARYKEAGIPFRWALRPQPWGLTDFTIIDPEGNWVSFAGPADESDDDGT